MFRFGLTFGGGGARGAAHIGVLMEMAHIGLPPPDLITGTSIGGLVGGLLAAGRTNEEMVAFFQQLSLTRLYGRPGGLPALSSHRKLETLLEQTIGRPTFAQLAIPLALVTVDLARRQEIVLDEGDVVSAILATTAFPVVLPPVKRNGLDLIDGGVLNNVPFDVARARGATHVVAIELGNAAPYGSDVAYPAGRSLTARALALAQRQPLWQLLSAVTDILTAQSFQAHLAISKPDLLLRPELGTIGLFDFHRFDEALTAGRQAVQDKKDEMLKICHKQ